MGHRSSFSRLTKHVGGHVLVSQADFVSSSYLALEANWSPLPVSERSLCGPGAAEPQQHHVFISQVVTEKEFLSRSGPQLQQGLFSHRDSSVTVRRRSDASHRLSLKKTVVLF